MGKIGVVIVDGVGYRNFVLSNCLNELLKTKKDVVIFSGLKKSIYSDSFLDLQIEELDIYKEKKLSWIFRKAKELAHLQNNKKIYSIANTLESQKSKKKSKRSLINNILIKFTAIFHSEKYINFFYLLQLQSFKKNTTSRKYIDLLKKNDLDLLFFTHQRPPYLAILDAAAKDLGIKTCSFIFSWDNLPSKGRMAAPFDSFLVWSDLMREELHCFYPNTKNKPVHIVGTPQFEPYVMEEYKSSKNDFKRKFSVNPHLKTICYSCGDASTSQNDVLYIETIMQSMLEGRIPEFNFIVRTSPAEDGSRFENTKKKYPSIIWNFPHWEITREDHPEPWSQRIPFKDDLRDLRSLLEYCDLNINMCSTMSLDFMIFDKPVINPVFGNEDNGLYNDQKYLKYAHYERVVKSGAVAIAKNAEELINAINFSLENPEARLQEQRELLKLQIGKPLEGTSLSIAKALKEIS